MAKKTITYEVKSTIGKVAKDTEKLQKNTKKATKEVKELNKEGKEVTSTFTLFGLSLNSVKSGFTKITATSKLMFSSIKAGLISTGIGAFLIAVGSLTQYFRDSEAGASKFKEISSQLGVVLGNVTDIVSDVGKSLFKLMSGDLDGFKEGLKEVKKGIGEFGEATSEEMAKAKQLEKDRLALQQFERKAQVDKAKAEAEMMELRLKARDLENFDTNERLAFMREANEIAAIQLEKDLHVAEEKLRFRQEENSYSKSTQENLDEEARLEADLFRIKKANFSERKRMKSEEIALVNEANANEKAILKEQEDAEKVKADKLKEANKLELEQTKTFQDKLIALENETTLLLIEDEKERAAKQLEIQRDTQLREIENMKITEEQKLKLKESAENKYQALVRDNAKKTTKVIELTEGQKLSIISNFAGAVGKLANDNKQLAVAEALINTYSGVTQALNDKTMPSTVGRLAMAGTVLATGLANVKSILSTKLPTGDSGGSIGGVQAQAPAPQMLSGSFELGGNEEQKPLKAYVVTDEITDSQSGLSKIRERATI
ncbi:hypothetical protein [uncultured Mediterranean phage uvMED]|nr:hypothetical protein [uncultured Mediterranean phage uvMED]